MNVDEGDAKNRKNAADNDRCAKNSFDAQSDVNRGGPRQMPVRVESLKSNLKRSASLQFCLHFEGVDKSLVLINLG